MLTISTRGASRCGFVRKALVQIQASSNRGMMPYGGGVEGLMSSRWTESADTAVCLAAALDWEHGGGRLVELADRLGRTEAAVRQRASRLRALQLQVNRLLDPKNDITLGNLQLAAARSGAA